MKPWYRELSLRNRLLMVAACAPLQRRMSVTEMAVLTVLVNQSDRMGVRHRSDLWQDGKRACLLDREDRDFASQIFPYTRQGIEKALDGLHERGWIEYDQTTADRWGKDPGVRVLTVAIMADAPKWLRFDTSSEPTAVPLEVMASSDSLEQTPTSVAANRIPKNKPTSVPTGSTRNGRSKRPKTAAARKVPPGAKGDRSKPALSTPESAADHAEAAKGKVESWLAKAARSWLEPDVGHFECSERGSGTGRYEVSFCDTTNGKSGKWVCIGGVMRIGKKHPIWRGVYLGESLDGAKTLKAAALAVWRRWSGTPAKGGKRA